MNSANYMNIKQPWLNPKELTDFIDELREADYNIGLPQYFATLNLVSNLVGMKGQDSQNILKDPSNFRSLLGPILCSSEVEQKDFQKRYKERFGGSEPNVTQLPNEVIQEKEEIEQVNRIAQQTWILTLATLATLLITNLITKYFINLQGNNPLVDPLVDPLADPLVDPLVDPLINLKPESNLEQWWLIVGSLVLCTLLFLLLRFYWFRNRYLKHFITVSKPNATRLRFKIPSNRLFPSRELSRTAMFLRRRKSIYSDKLNIELTIKKTLERGGFFTPEYGTRRIQPEHLFLIDSASSVDHLAVFANWLAEQLEHQVVNLYAYTFDGDPRLCFPKDPTQIPLSLSDLAEQYHNYRLIIFSDATSWINPLTGVLETWVETLKTWSECALFTSREIETWGKLEESLSQFIRIFTNDYKGFQEFAENLSINNKNKIFKGFHKTESYPIELYLRPLRWLERDKPESEMINKVLESLKEKYLDVAGYYWLCSCAVYPEVKWELTIYLGNTLYKGGNKIFSESRFKKLIRLPWFQHGYIPDWLRKELIKGLTPSQVIDVRNVLTKLLLSTYKNPNATYSIDTILDIYDNSTESLKQKLIRLFASKLGQESQLKDKIFLRFLLKPSLLDFKLYPEIIRRHLMPFWLKRIIGWWTDVSPIGKYKRRKNILTSCILVFLIANLVFPTLAETWSYFNKITIQGLPLSFWWAQNGAIYIFIFLALLISVIMSSLDKAFNNKKDR